MRTRLGADGRSSATNQIRPSIASSTRRICVATERLPSSTLATKSWRPLAKSVMGSDSSLYPNRSKAKTTMYTPSTKRPAKSSIMNILLKTLIACHLEIVYYHHGLASSGLRRDALPYVLCDLWYRRGQRVAGHDVYLQILRGYHNARDFLAAFVGRGFHEAPATHGIDPFGGEGRQGGRPRQFDSVCQKISLALAYKCYCTRCCSWASCSRCCCSSWRCRSCSASCCGKKMLETVMFTSFTRRPTRLSTLLATLRLTASASWGIDLPYSAVSVRSIAASSWPTSTETPWVWLPLLPPVMLPRRPLTA